MNLGDLTVDQLARWEVPTRADTDAYWAHQRTLIHPQSFQLPRKELYRILPQEASSITIYVDSHERWLWAEIPTHGWSWKTFEQLRTMPEPADHEVIPAWVRTATRNYPTYPDDVHRSNFPLLVRRRVSSAEVNDLLDQVMPPVGAYPLPEHLAAVLRRGGWGPRDLGHLWWQVETEADAAALAAHPPHWWDRHGWLLHRGGGSQPVPSLPAAMLTDLVDRGIRPELVEECAVVGITDLERICSYQPPAFPDDATRIAYPARGAEQLYFDVEPVAARRTLERYPALWLRAVTWDTGVQPLHIASAWDGDPCHLVAWSDGQLHFARVHPPAQVPTGEPMRTWHRRYREFEATQKLLIAVLDAANGDELDSEVWMPWRGAERTDTTTLDTHTRSRAIGADTIADRTVLLQRHTIRGAAGQQHQLWQVSEQITVGAGDSHDQSSDTRHPKLRAHTLHRDHGLAHQAWQTLHDDIPPVATIEEIATMASMTRDALAQALSRARKAYSAQLTAAVRSLDVAYPDEVPSSVTRVGPARWYEPRRVLTWLNSRPGHGPGRGHTHPMP